MLKLKISITFFLNITSGVMFFYLLCARHGRSLTGESPEHVRWREVHSQGQVRPSRGGV